MPDFLGPEPEGYIGNWERSCNAWQRRFLSLQFTIPIDLDPLPVNWQHNSVHKVCREFYMLTMANLPDAIAKLFAPYTEHISKDIDAGDQWKEEFAAIANAEEDWLDQNLPKVKPKLFMS